MYIRLIAPLLAAIALSACSWLTPYKLDIPQGNEVTADQVEQLKAGMSRSQVRFVLGTPLLEDPFHANRWDYIYSDARSGKLKEKKTFTVFFEGDKAVRWQGETLPARKKIDAAEFDLNASAPAAAPTAVPTAAQPAASSPAAVETRPLTE
ncbi:outer membrane protein assembly factor BamE [Andreprevotia chitinilytica]|uniref:outer membrane protein assembly factor BamE n=1 Tax=Andreprevotia chitinilytica TaxID=396808 RepID=UPI00068C6A63|nr:outer membrane protein assembly factor BamE [Andreprevotia chitinilytica]